MKKEVIVRVTGVQKSPDAPAERTETVSEGVYFCKDQKQYVLYEECPDPEMPEQKTKTRITWSEDRIILRKEGAVYAEMQFEAGADYGFEYKTPFGSFAMKITDSVINIEESESEKRIHIVYHLTVQEVHKTKNEIQILIRDK